MGLLHTTFQDRVISRNRTQTLSLISCDLTSLDFFLWGYIKSKVYVNKPQALEELKEKIRTKIADVHQDLCGRVLQNFMELVDACHQARSGHLPDIIFHT